MIRLLKIYLTLIFLLITTFCMAQKSELKLCKDGKFKIVQFTDVHFKYGNLSLIHFLHVILVVREK